MKTTPAAEKLPNTIDPSLDLDKVKKECLGMVKKRARVSAGVAAELRPRCFTGGRTLALALARTTLRCSRWAGDSQPVCGRGGLPGGRARGRVA